MHHHALLAATLVAALTAGESVHLEVQTGHADSFGSLACSPDGRLIATSAFDQTVRLWDIASGLQVRTLVGHAYSEVTGVGFSADGTRVYSASDGAMVHRVADGGIEASCSDALYCLGALPGGGQLVRMPAGPGKVGLGRRRDGAVTLLAAIDPASIEQNGWIGGTDVFWVWGAGQLRALHAGSSEPAFREAGPRLALPAGLAVKVMQPSPDLRWLALTCELPDGGQKTRRLQVFSLGDGARVLDAVLPEESGAYYERLLFVPGRQEVLHSRGPKRGKGEAVDPGVTGFTWPGGARRRFSATPLGTEAMDCTPDGRLLATADWDRVLRLWDLASGALLREARTVTEPARLAVVAAPDGRRWALQDQRQRGAPWRILDLATGRIAAEVPDAQGVPAFSV
ncbi:MAG: hypothetical protein J0M02_08130, partial [Planctomycetes bacterium]|nr:hypothetical protein [Planctomycetota bacterium]